LLTYLSIPAVALFGLRVEVLRGVSALIGAAAIPIVYYLALQLFRRRDVAVVAMWLMAVLPWAVHMSRWAIIPTVVPTMVAGTMLVTVWAVQNRSVRAIVYAGLLAGITVAAYHAMKVYVPLLLLAVVAVYWRELRRIGLEPLAYAAALFLAIAGPILYLTVRDPGGGARMAQTSVLNDHALTPGLLVTQYASYFQPSFWFLSGDGDVMHLPEGWGLFPIVLAPFLIGGLAYAAWLAFKRSDSALRNNARFFLLAIALYPVAGMLTLPSPHVLRAVHVMPLAVIVAAMGIIGAVDLIREVFLQRRPMLVAATAVFAVAMGMALGAELAVRYEYYFNRYPNEVAENFRYGTRDAIQYAAQHESEYDEVWLNDNNSSYIYLLFYRRWDPSDVHNNLLVKRHAPDWNQTISIGKYHFGEPSLTSAPREVFASKHAGKANGYRVSAATTNEGRVLVIEPAR
jgi:4-amino-4-deoxy-L-arabinose transferase-like glycosyltransferase